MSNTIEQSVLLKELNNYSKLRNHNDVWKHVTTNENESSFTATCNYDNYSKIARFLQLPSNMLQVSLTEIIGDKYNTKLCIIANSEVSLCALELARLFSPKHKLH